MAVELVALIRVDPTNDARVRSVLRKYSGHLPPPAQFVQWYSIWSNGRVHYNTREDLSHALSTHSYQGHISRNFIAIDAIERKILMENKKK